MNFDLALTKPQRDFALHDAPYPAMVAGLGAGKSEAGIVRMVLLMLENYQHTRETIDTLIAFPTYDLCRLRGISGLEEILERAGIPYITNKAEYSVSVGQFGRVLFRSYDRPERIVAFQVAHSLCDEIDTLPKEKAEVVWRKIAERTRQKSYRKNSIACATTPDQGFNGFVYKKWGKNPADGYALIKAPTASNPFLPEGYIEQIKSNYDPMLAEMYLEGEFVNLTASKVYHFFDRVKHHTTRQLEQGDRLIHVSVDFNIGGCCSVVWVIDDNVPTAVDEFISHDTYDFVNNLAQYDGRKIVVYPDATGKRGTTNATQSDIGIIENAGYYVDAPNANPPVRDRVNAFNALLSHGKLLVNTNKCQNLTHALESQGYDDKGYPEKFSDHPAIDDWTDNAGYFIHRKWPINKPAASLDVRFAS